MPVHERFTIGDRWVSFKIYCGPSTANMLLLKCMAPLIKEMENSLMIDKWFFIRYNDPDSHLRRRFHLTTLSNFGAFIMRIKEVLRPYRCSMEIWDVQLHGYQRELERYGDTSIALVESFFYHDSKLMILTLENTFSYEDYFSKFLSAFRK